MYNKLTIQDLVAVYVEKGQLQEHEALKFVTSVFQIIREGLERDKLVRIKGLGTFKLIDVDSRESVNVNNGERVLIEGHTKISFQPDATMKELVNKPFSSFETVILNEGVEFGDMGDTASEPAIIDDESDEDEPAPAPEQAGKNVELHAEENPDELLVQLAEEPEHESVEEPVEEMTDEPVEEVADEPVEEVVDESVEEVADEPVEEAVEEPVQEESSEEDTVEDSAEELSEKKERPGFRFGWMLWLLLCVACFAAGYYIGRTTGTVVEVCPSVELQDTIVKSIAADTIAKPVKSADSIAKPAVKPAEAIAKPVAKPADTKPAEPKPDYLKYDAMDARLRTGAYYIMGTASEVTVKEGETLYRISRRMLGEDMSCYIEVYNGVTPSTLKAGQILKIPKLEPKKAVRKRMEKKQ